MKYLKEYNLFESLFVDDKLVSDLVKDVMGEYENYEFDYKVTNVNDHPSGTWYKMQFVTQGDENFVILEITPDESMVCGRGFSTIYKFTDEWAKMLIFLSKHLSDYGYKSSTITHISSGVNQFATIPQYVSRVYRETGKGGPTGETFRAPFMIYITKI